MNGIDPALIAEVREAWGGKTPTADDLRRAIKLLPERQAAAMWLYWIEGVTNRSAIARRMGIAPKNVTALLARGHRELLNTLAVWSPVTIRN